MRSNLTENEKLVIAFLKMLEERRSAAELEQFYHPDIEQVEYPNTISKNTAIRQLNDLKDGAERGKKIFAKEEFEIVNLYSMGDTVILEAIWKGTLSVQTGNLHPGEQMIAHFAQFFDFKAGKIFRQRNYDCFEPFS